MQATPLRTYSSSLYLKCNKYILREFLEQTVVQLSEYRRLNEEYTLEEETL